MAAMVMVRVMGSEDDGLAEVVGEGKEGDEGKGCFHSSQLHIPTYLGTLVKNVKHAFLPKVCFRNCIELLLRRRELEIPF